MKIGKLNIEGHTVLAPLAGITNLPFRRIVKRCGCSLVCSEMVSVKGLLYNSEKTFSLLQSDQEERPLSVQIFGSEPSEMAKAAAFIEERGGADIIDINFGCSVKKVVRTGAGVALMQNIANAEDIIRSVREVISIPLTIKIRSGWDSSGIEAFRIAQMAQKCGVDAITFHPRTASQGFRGKADWTLIERLKPHLSIPLIGNGDIVSAVDGLRMIHQTGCDAVMVGRAALSNPFILSEIEFLLAQNVDIADSYQLSGRYSHINSSKSLKDPLSEIYSKIYSPDEVFSVMKELLSDSVEYFGEATACKMMRSRLVWFVKGWPGCSAFRRNLTNIESMSQAIELIDEYGCFLMSQTGLEISKMPNYKMSAES
ncbi:MAG: tRNA-dihydrouridine synthase [Desulfamplus sp.]|nr:tRNA-dihydrouridine synthase [Desulfamplus sp.]